METRLGNARARGELTLGLLYGLVDNPHRYGSTYFALARRANEPVAVVTRTGAYPAVIVDVGADAATACAALAADVVAGVGEAPSANGAVPIIDEFAAALRGVTGRVYPIRRRMQAFELRRLTPPAGVPGSLRPAVPSDAALVEEWSVAFHREALPDTKSEDAHRRGRELFDAGDVWLWDHNGAVSTAAVSRRTRRSATISYVYTPPQWRGRGYASAAVAGVTNALLRQGFSYCSLFTDLANPTSNRIYQALGYEPRATFHEYHPG